MKPRRDELDHFKSNINLVEFVQSYGFQIVRKKSSQNNFIVANDSGEKLAIARRRNGHWTYLDVRTETGGTIVDFVQSRELQSLGEVRKVLRKWNGTGELRPSTYQAPSVATVPEVDTVQIMGQWERAKPVTSLSPYLKSRAIPYSVIVDPIFRDRIRIDDRSNLLFPHLNLDGDFTGFEMKNWKFTAFTTGGAKGLWCSRARASDRILVFCETALDAISFAALFGTEQKRFFSTGGRISSYQQRCIKSAVAKMRAGSEVWLAMDHDDAGKRMAESYRQIITRTDLVISDRLPKRGGQDWNDVLRLPRQVSTPTPHFNELAIQ